jgi:hypothetical protein
MHGSLCTLGYDRQDYVIVNLKSLDQQGKPFANFGDPYGCDPDRARIARARDLELGVIAKGSADSIEITAHPRSVELPEEVVDIRSVRHLIALMSRVPL